jgi:hypothetical protein
MGFVKRAVAIGAEVGQECLVNLVDLFRVGRLTVGLGAVVLARLASSFLGFALGSPLAKGPAWRLPARRASARNKTWHYVPEYEKDEAAEDMVASEVRRYVVGGGFGQNDKSADKHPAAFPEQLVADHILTWSKPGESILDPMFGSGTSCSADHAWAVNSSASTYQRNTAKTPAADWLAHAFP